MASSSTLAFNAATGVLSGTLSFAAPVTIPPTASTTVAEIVITVCTRSDLRTNQAPRV